MCRAPHYQVCSFETDDKSLPLVEFDELKLDCQMIILSEQRARFVIVSVTNPFAGVVSVTNPVARPRAKYGTLNLTAIDYVIYAERANGNFVSQGFRHDFRKPVQLAGSDIDAAPRKLFTLVPLNELLREKYSRAALIKDFACTKGVQFVA